MIFKKREKGLADLLKLELPVFDIRWNDNWVPITNKDSQLIWQKELNAELSSKHPLWGLQPVVFGRGDGTDDAIVVLNNEKFAIVHLVWHGHVDQMPNKFPLTGFFNNIQELQSIIDQGPW